MIDLLLITIFSREFECVHYLDLSAILCTQKRAKYWNRYQSKVTEAR
jgi:hypothetical protein